ncbi:thymidine phosphorylase [Longibacter salinarum]|uniref:thymidine phosphorylase n=1 Tax=Longibacter salinarum TaxID=1850348 RepID=A0A2A8CUR9_9BACT|nr:thymidine phosphorylase [Longibacter salinarum]PEN11291.1 thymidine phosphorylase [Longibacter salinarum]
MPDVNPVHLIAHKRDGQSLDPDDIRAFINAYTAGDVPDYQMSAFLMATYLNGLDDAEAAALTDAMLHSGRVLDLSDLSGTKVDKHSTGGVGDKVSLILAPVVAACGVPVPMISGRGLGHTGGTLDKLESIPGFRTDLSIETYRQQLEDIGLVLIGQTAEMAPADRKLYALRDVTATVESIPLIAASIMSKKLAEGIDALVLDVKCGRGAFMKTEKDARKLAETLTAIGEKNGTPTTALMTRMDVPLGRAVGNWPEVAESIECLRGEHDDSELMEVTIGLAGEMLALGGVADSPEEGREQARASVADGSALDTFRTLVETQDGDPTVIDDPSSRPGSEPVAEVVAPDSLHGTITDIDALAIGFAAVDLGAGRRTKEDTVDPTAGLVFERRVGDQVKPGDVLARLYAKDESRVPAAQEAIADAFTAGDEAPESTSAILDRYTRNGWLHGTNA